MHSNQQQPVSGFIEDRQNSHELESQQKRLNIVVRQSWAYSEMMPVIPVIDAGLSPVAQWIVLPLASFWFARRPLRSCRKPPAGDPQIIPLRSQGHV